YAQRISRTGAQKVRPTEAVKFAYIQTQCRREWSEVSGDGTPIPRVCRHHPDLFTASLAWDACRLDLAVGLASSPAAAGVGLVSLEGQCLCLSRARCGRSHAIAMWARCGWMARPGDPQG